MMRWRWLAAFRAPCIALLLAALGACGGGAWGLAGPRPDGEKRFAPAPDGRVEVVEGGGVVQPQPLEPADAALGGRVGASLVVAAGVASDITLQWDIEHSLVRFAGNTG